MSTPLYSVYVRSVFPRGVVLNLSSMAADPTQEELTHDFALQLLLEAHAQTGLKPAPEAAEVLAGLHAELQSPDRNYQALLNASQHYIYYVTAVENPHADEAEGSSVEVAIGGRFPWLFASLRPGMHWETTAFSFAMHA